MFTHKMNLFTKWGLQDDREVNCSVTFSTVNTDLKLPKIQSLNLPNKIEIN